jgi:hypothetical protein
VLLHENLGLASDLCILTQNVLRLIVLKQKIYFLERKPRHCIWKQLALSVKGSVKGQKAGIRFLAGARIYIFANMSRQVVRFTQLPIQGLLN